MKFIDMSYRRIKYEDVEGQFKEIMESAKGAKSGEEQFAIHKQYYALTNKVNTMMTIAHIRHDIDMTDDYYSGENEYYNRIRPMLANLTVEYKQILYRSPYREYMEEKIGKVAFKNMELELKSFDEKLIPLMQEENALTTRYNTLIAGAKIEWEGEILNLSLLKPYLTSSDREIRKKAYEKYSAFFISVADELDEIYDELVKNRTGQARLMGYEDYTQLAYYRMNRNCYDKEMVENYRRQIKEFFVPFAEELHERRRKRLGIDELTFIDEGVYFTGGNPKPTGTPDEILAAGQKMYAEMSAETKEFFDFMVENQLFDVLGRKNKKAGGYMTTLPEYGAPFIFANFNGTSDDVDVITHECGHAFQGYVSGKDPIQEHWDITMETAEVHSMSMEFFAERWISLFFGERAQDYKNMHLEYAASFIPYGCMVDEFQHIVYAHPELTPEERHKKWLELEAEYRPHMDYAGDLFFGKGGFWQKQLHIYDYPFYYIDYCLAQTCAFQYKVWMDEDYEAAWKSYLELCRLSAADFFTDMIKKVGLNSPFEDGCVENIINKLRDKVSTHYNSQT